jgi:hypothetical protein
VEADSVESHGLSVIWVKRDSFPSTVQVNRKGGYDAVSGAPRQEAALHWLLEPDGL